MVKACFGRAKPRKGQTNKDNQVSDKRKENELFYRSQNRLTKLFKVSIPRTNKYQIDNRNMLNVGFKDLPEISCKEMRYEQNEEW